MVIFHAHLAAILIFFVLYCMFGPCAKALLPLAHRHSQAGAEIHIQLPPDCGIFSCMGPILLIERRHKV